MLSSEHILKLLAKLLNRRNLPSKQMDVLLFLFYRVIAYNVYSFCSIVTLLSTSVLGGAIQIPID